MSDKKRLPPGQHLTKHFPVLQHDGIITIDRDNYTLTIIGQVENPKSYSLNELISMKDSEKVFDIHCVTTWSKFDTKWSGISFQKLFKEIKPKESAKFVEFLCADGNFTTSVPIEALQHEDAILALYYEGKPIDDSHGGPVRPVFPQLYFYKSAKWTIQIEFLKEDRLGYWEQGGYSNKADPWKEQRYSSDDRK